MIIDLNADYSIETEEKIIQDSIDEVSEDI